MTKNLVPYVRLDCCGLELRNVVIPIHHDCPNEPNVLRKIEACEFRKGRTGEVIKCNCPGNQDQAVYECSIKGKCIKHAANQVPHDVTVCLGCEVVRN